MTKDEMLQQITRLTHQLADATARAERAEEARPDIADVTGYYILPTTPDANADLWDGELHATYQSAHHSLTDPCTMPPEGNDGFAVYECRQLAHP